MEDNLDIAGYPRNTRVAVVGTGLVGATYAYSLLLYGIADEIRLIDVKVDKARGEAMDLNHAMALTRPTNIWAGDMDDLEGSDVIMIAAGIPQKPGQSRMDLLKENAKIVGDIAEEAGRAAPQAVLLITTNPVDVMSYVAMKRSGLPYQRVFGSGTALDTARLRFLVGSALNMDPKSIHAFVLGEHGDSEMVAWSRAQVAGTNIDAWPQMTSEAREEIENDVRLSAYQIIRMKGATYYAIGLVLARITESILKDSRTVYSVSSYLTGEYGIYDVYLGVPAVIGREGVLRTIEIPLSKEELAQLQRSGRVVKDATSEVGLGREEIVRGSARGVPRVAAQFEASSEFVAGIADEGHGDVDEAGDDDDSSHQIRRPKILRPKPIFKRPRPIG